MTNSPIQASRVAALRLQRERSAAYQQWTALFHRALIGDITPRELQRNIQGIILPEFQRISTALRSLQRSLETQVGDSSSNSSSGAEPLGSSALPVPLDNKHAAERRLACWIEQLQSLEREHYGVSLALANQLADHCTPNVLAASASAEGEAGAAAQGESASGSPSQLLTERPAAPSREVVPATMASLFKPDDDGDDGSAVAGMMGEVEFREQRTRGPHHPPPPPPSQPSPADKNTHEESVEAEATLRVHDAARCALLRLIPPRYHAHLFFVSCRDGIDELKGASDTALSPSADRSDEERDEERSGGDVLPLFGKETKKDSSRPLALYSPAAVATRCVAWSGAVETVVRRQESLRAAIEDLCDDLQADISDG